MKVEDIRMLLPTGSHPFPIIITSTPHHRVSGSIGSMAEKEVSTLWHQTNRPSKMTHFTTIALEMKLQIFKSIDSVKDLSSLYATCSNFYNIRKSGFAKSIALSVFEKETAAGITAELVALAKLRKLKAWRGCDSKTIEELNAPDLNGITWPADDPSLSELVGIRRTVCWFTRQFFEYHLAKRKQTARPSTDEIARVEDAFCLFWLWIEAADDQTQQLSDSIEQLLCDALMSAQPHRKASPHSALMLTVYHFLLSKLEKLGLSYARTLDTAYVQSIAEWCNCFTLYLRVGIPSLLLMHFGLDGVTELLRGSPDDRSFAVAKVFDHVKLRALDAGSWGDDNIGINRLYGLLDGYSIGDLELSTRPLWKCPGRTYNPKVRAWGQLDPLDYEAIFWDDERLIRWGYHVPLHIIASTRNRKDLARRKFLERICTECRPEWKCREAPEDPALCGAYLDPYNGP
ncbi:hypothetical protein Dda_1730 [Drechslerella dactyloides]|uniref:F-box domain-containing protein n=1 Tax=Drechslerella dactyloides TaxID=74499 RepID=A0AAD6NLP6_DREDA|nr:hypothetical protein Dda_1730 [Drechslerella dactyloides]